MTTTLILGAGFGGLATARTLRSLLGEEHRIVVLDHAPAFAVGATKTWVMTGERTVEEVSRPRDILVPPGVELIETEVTAFDAATGEVTTEQGTLQGDHLVIALGADPHPAAVPGLEEAAESFYTMEGALRLREVLREFSGGELVILIAGKPFKCPPAPYEAAMLLHEMFEERGMRIGVRLSLYTFEPTPMGTAGPDAGARMQELLADRNIAFHPQHTATGVDPKRRVITFENGAEAGYDVLLAVPPHRPPRVVRESALATEGGWIPVDPQTLKPTVADGTLPVYAIGDVTTVPLPGRYRPEVPLVLPKAGIMAAAHGRVVAERIAAHVRGEVPTAAFDGRGYCYIETGRGEAMRGGGDFFALPHPEMEQREPDARQMREKLAWVAEWLSPTLQP